MGATVGLRPRGLYVLRQGNGAALPSADGQHGGVPDLLWDDVGSLFAPDTMGTLPEV